MMKKILVASCLMAASLFAHAGNSEGPVSDYIMSAQGKLFFIAGAQVSRPSCSTMGAWAVDLAGTNAAGGRGILAVIIAAKAAGKSIKVFGTGTCDVWGDRETVSYVQVL
jgi:hypothetical protein